MADIKSRVPCQVLTITVVQYFKRYRMPQAVQGRVLAASEYGLQTE